MFSRRFTLFLFSCFFLVETLINQGVELTEFQWVQLAFAASMIGRVSAYLSVFEWFRAIFAVVEPHSSGAGADWNPRWYVGPLSAVSELICCPVCAGTWGAALLLSLMKYAPQWGEAILLTLSAAALAWFISFSTELVEWKKHEARENTGFTNRANRNGTP